VAFRVLGVLAVMCAFAGIALFFLHAFSYVIVLALAAVFALGAVAARGLQRSQAPH
jgi:hypothetical protein